MSNKALHHLKSMVPLATALFGAGMMAFHYYSVATGYDPGILYKVDERFLLLLLSTAVIGAIFGNIMNRPWEKGANIVLIAFFTLMIIGKSLQSMGGLAWLLVFLAVIPIGIILLIVVSMTRFRADEPEEVNTVATTIESKSQEKLPKSESPSPNRIKVFNAFAVSVKTLAILVCAFPLMYFLVVLATLP